MDGKLKHGVFIKNEQKIVTVTPALRALIKRAAAAALDYEQFPAAAEISVTLCGDERIRQLNAQYRAIDRPTDVLSFPLYGADEDIELVDGERAELGDIVISAETAQRQARLYGHSIERELAFLCVHSVLHLLGYDHETSEEDETRMFAKQDEIMKALGL